MVVVAAASVGLPEAVCRMLPPTTARRTDGVDEPTPMLPALSMVVEPVEPNAAVLPVMRPPKRFVVDVALSVKRPPTTSSLASVVVEDAPMSTWLVVVETRMAELLNQVQFISPVPPDAPASTPQENVPAPHKSLSAVPLQAVSPAPVSVPAKARLPAASMVVVAVAPKRAAEALSTDEVNRLVVVALAKVADDVALRTPIVEVLERKPPEKVSMVEVALEGNG